VKVAVRGRNVRKTKTAEDGEGAEEKKRLKAKS